MPPRKSLRNEERSTPKIIVLLTLITLITSLTSVVLTSYPQHLAVDNKTVLGEAQFIGNNTAIVKGHQVQYGTNDIIGLQGRNYIKLTGRQVQLPSGRSEEGIRTIFAEWNQNLLLQQTIGSFNISNQPQIAQIGVGNTVFNLIPISQDVLNVNVVDLTGKMASSTYNLQLVQSTTYLSENGIMLELSKGKDNTITITLIGSGYNNIWMRVL